MAQKLVYHWKHGWIPLDRAAALSKAHGRQSVAANPVGKDFRSMTPAEKIKAAEIMYGTGSKQHQAAKKRFGGKP